MATGNLRKFFLQVAPGLEKVLERELLNLKIPGEFVPGSGGAWAYGPDDILWQIALKSRVCEGVQAAIMDPFHCAHESKMLQSVRQAPWSQFLSTDVEAVHVKVRTDPVSRLQHERMIQNLIRRGLEVSEEAPEKEAKVPQVNVLLKHDKCYLSVDATGPLAHRGYHTSPGNAPLRETLSSAILLASKVERHLEQSNKGIILWDPFCGSGTILLEALSSFLGNPPGNPKLAYPFREFPSHSEDRYQSMISNLELTPHPRVHELYLIGTDRDEQQIEAAQRNYRRLKRRMPRPSGTDEPDIPCSLDFFNSRAIPFGEKLLASSKKDIVIVTNVPYGKRVGNDEENRKLHQQLSIFAKRNKDRVRGIYMLTQKNSLPKASEGQLDWRTELRFSNGGIPVELLSWSRERVSFK